MDQSKTVELADDIRLTHLHLRWIWGQNRKELALLGVLDNATSQRISCNFVLKRINSFGVTESTEYETYSVDAGERVIFQHNFWPEHPHNGWHIKRVEVNGHVRNLDLNLKAFPIWRSRWQRARDKILKISFLAMIAAVLFGIAAVIILMALDVFRQFLS